MCYKCGSTFFNCVKVSSEEIPPKIFKANRLFGSFATAGFVAYVIKEVPYILGYEMHPLIPFLLGLACGSVSCCISMAEPYFPKNQVPIQEKEDPGDNLDDATPPAGNDFSL